MILAKKILAGILIGTAIVYGGVLVASMAAAEPPSGSEQGLLPCPNSPNCVSSRAAAGDSTHFIEPIRFEGPPEEVWMALKSVVRSLPRSTIVAESSGYLHFEVRTLPARTDPELDPRHGLVGESVPMIELCRFIRKAAPTRATVLIQGEGGTGKERVARALHSNSQRSGGRFVAVNCAALSEALLESELFGHEKGAFTGAVVRQKGKFELASGGTLFLDEVGELGSAIQAKLLRALEEREIDRIGGGRPIAVDIRLIAATNRNLESAVAAGRFRQDLYYRLKVLSVRTPALAERRDDIPALARYFVFKCAREAGRVVRGISPEALAILGNYDWPGNVRELRNAIEYAVVLGSSDHILAEDLPDDILETTSAEPLTYHDAIDETKRRLFEAAFSRSNGDYKEAARLLGLHPKAIHRCLQNLNLSYLLSVKSVPARE